MNFSECEHLTDNALAHLSRCSLLEAVDLESCRNLTDTAAMHLATCAQLQSVAKILIYLQLAGWPKRATIARGSQWVPKDSATISLLHNSHLAYLFHMAFVFCQLN